MKQSRGRAAAAAGAAAHSVEETTAGDAQHVVAGGSHVKELFVSHDESTTLGFIYTNIKPKSCTTSSTCKSTPFCNKVQFYCGQTRSPNLKFPTLLFSEFSQFSDGLTFLPLRGNKQAVHPPRQFFVEKVPTKNGKPVWPALARRRVASDVMINQLSWQQQQQSPSFVPKLSPPRPALCMPGGRNDEVSS